MAEKKTQGLTVKKENFSEWYVQIIQKAELIDKRLENSSGFYGYPPWGAEILRNIEMLYEKELSSKNHKLIRTPTAIPKILLDKEKKHATGFAPEVFLITKGRGDKKLKFPKVLRPTGEAIMYPYFRYWIQTYKDLPFKVFETRPSFRAERTNAVFPLLRSCEFYWIEAHTTQTSNDYADLQIKEDVSIFNKVASEKLAIPFMIFKRPEWDKFAGADYTCAYDSPLPDGKISQIGTTHNLGINFAKAFDVQYVDENNETQYCYQTSFGIGVSKILGMLVAIHGDDAGLILPHEITPIQFVIIPIYYGDEQKKEVMKNAENLKSKLEGFKCTVDAREDYTPGWKFNEWELKGVPIRIEIGPKDIEKKQAVFVRRVDNKKSFIKLEEITKDKLEKMLSKSTEIMYEKAKKMFNISTAKKYKDILNKIDKGYHLIKIPFCGIEKCATKLKEETIKVRGIELFNAGCKTIKQSIESSKKEAKGKKCAVCGKNAEKIVWVGRQY